MAKTCAAVWLTLFVTLAACQVGKVSKGGVEIEWDMPLNILLFLGLSMAIGYWVAVEEECK